MFEGHMYVAEHTNDAFMYRVYGWMSAALAVTAATAWYLFSQVWFYQMVLDKPLLLLVVFLAQLGLVVTLSALLHKLSYATAVVLFLVYAVSIGVTMSLIFRVYTLSSIASTFVVTSGMFGGMALYGYMTKTDLTGVRNASIMALWGIILAMIVNVFLQSFWVDYVVSMVGVVLFTLLTAADTQKIKQLQQQLIADRQTRSKVALLGALTLYLDFINLFLFLLRFMGGRRNQ